MKKSRLYCILIQLSTKELREFDDFVQSPYFNKRNNLVKLFQYLQYCLFNNNPPERSIAFKKIYPKIAYDDTKLRLAMSDLLKLVERFLIQKEQEQNEIAACIQLASAYRQRNLPKQFQRTLRKLRLQQAKQIIRNDEYFNYNYQIELESFEFTSLNQRVTAESLQAISDNIDFAYLALKLKQTCFLLSHQNIQKANYRLGLIDEIITYVRTENYLDIPAIAIYYYTYFLLTQPQEEIHFQQLKQILGTYTEQFPRTEIRDVYLMAINFCIKKINSGHTKYFDECLDLYEEALSKELLLENGILSRFTLNNIIGLGLKRKNYQRVENFIYEYSPKIEPAYRENALNFNLARLHYERKNYAAALQSLVQVDDKDPLFTLIAKTLQLKIYYETDEFSVLEAHLDSMRTYVKRKKNIAYHAANYLNIIKYVKKLISINPFAKSDIQKLAQLIENEEVLTEKKWLLNQLRKL